MKINNLVFLTVFSLGILNACTSTSKKESQLPESRTQPSISTGEYNNSDSDVQIDYYSLQRLLGLERNITTLGFSEKSFNTCRVGFGYSANENCLNKYFVVIHFKLVCRDSEGTVSSRVQAENLSPVANRQIKWALKNATGKMFTDSGGFGQIIIVSALSQKKERFRLSANEDFLLLRAGEIKQLMVPSNWCN